MSNPEVAEGLKRLFSRRSKFILIGLTGRTGSGCTTASMLLSEAFSDLKISEPKRINANSDDRKYRIIKDYAQENWIPFFSISISNVILSFLLDREEDELKKFFSEFNLLNQPTQIDEFIQSWQPAKKSWDNNKNFLKDRRSTKEQRDSFLNEWRGPIQIFFTTVRNGLGPAATKILQLVGDNIRKSGDPFNSKHIPEKFYELPERISLVIEIIKQSQQDKELPAYIVLDALRNPFELLYFREKYAAFYVFAISTPDEDRERRLSIRKQYTAKQITELDKKEYPERGGPLSGYEAFTSQNIQSCLEKSDVYLTNAGFSTPNQEINTSSLAQQLIKYFSLILHPGLITPTQGERCMQIAFAARANSGCISRQVGAAITDEFNSIKAVGWNDVPAGQIPCLLRRATDRRSQI